MGAFSLIGAISGIILGTFAVAAVGTGAGAAIAGVIIAIAVVIACTSGILEFVAGILGLQGKLKAAQVIGWIILVLSVFSLIGTLTSGSVSASEVISSLCGIVLPILFVIGVRQSDSQSNQY